MSISEELVSNSNYNDNILVSIDIEIEANKTITLNIYSNDVIEEKIWEWCNKYNWNSQIYEALKQQIIEQLTQQIEEIEDRDYINDYNNCWNDSDISFRGNSSQTLRTNNKINEIDESRAIDTKNEKISGSSNTNDNKGNRFGKECERNYTHNNNNWNKKKNKYKNNNTTQEQALNNNNNKNGKQRSLTPVTNFEERWYKNYMESKPKKEQKLREKYLEEQEERDKDIIFRPQLNKHSLEIISAKYSKNIKIEDKWIKYGENIKGNLLRETAQSNALQQLSLTFKPSVNENSKILGKYRHKQREDELQDKTLKINPEYWSPLKSSDYMNKLIAYKTKYIPMFDKNKKTKIYQRDIAKPQINPEKIHDYLYIESKILKEKKEQERQKLMNQVYPFKPQVSFKTKSWTKDSWSGKETQEDMINRLKQPKLGIKSVDKKMIYKNEDMRDSKGNQLFKPTISRGAKNKDQRNISVNLNGYYDKKITKDTRSLYNWQLESTWKKKQITLNNKELIVFKTKMTKYKELFTAFDSDGDGWISSKKIKLTVLEENALELFTPLFEELQKYEVELDFKKFCICVDKFLTVQMGPENEFLVKAPVIESTNI